MSPIGSCVQGLVPSYWHYLGLLREFQKMGLRLRAWFAHGCALLHTSCLTLCFLFPRPTAFPHAPTTLAHLMLCPGTWDQTTWTKCSETVNPKYIVSPLNCSLGCISHSKKERWPQRSPAEARRELKTVSNVEVIPDSYSWPSFPESTHSLGRTVDLLK